MKTHPTFLRKRGFTLMELMVAMAITTIIVTVLVSITSIALDTWNRSRSELRASRQAKSMIDTIAGDFEALFVRRGNANEWLSAVIDPNLDQIGDKLKSSNASKLIFFTAATDRYDGQAGVDGKDNGGDVSCVAYQLDYKNPISEKVGFETFVLNRLLVNPDDSFKDLLGKTDLTSAFASYLPKLSDTGNFVCENVYQFTVTFHVRVTDATKTPPLVSDVPVTIGQDTTSFSIVGNGVTTVPADARLTSGRVTAMEVSVTVISDFGIDQLKRRSFTTPQKADFLAKNSYQYTKLVQLPGM